MWVDLSANWETFSSLDSINYYVDKCKDAGFNTLVVDVKGTGSAVARLLATLTPLYPPRSTRESPKK